MPESDFSKFVETFQQHVTSLVSNYIQANPEPLKEPQAFLQGLLSIYNEWSTFSADNFNGDPVFHAAIDKSMRTLNTSKVNPSEVLIKHSDTVLKGGSEKDLDDIVRLFSLVFQEADW